MNVDPRLLQAIVFDVDGTLYRQAGLRRAMMFRLLREMALRPGSGVATFRALRAYRHAQELLRGTEVDGDLAAAQLRLASERSGQSEAMVTRVVARWMEHEPLALLGRFVDPALRAFLVAARSRGLALGVFSDYPAASKLGAMGLTEFFSVVVAAQDAAVNRFKPHPSGLAEALRRLGAPPDRALYVGDRHDVDAAVARALGVPCVIVGGRGKVTSTVGWTCVSDYLELQAILFPPKNELTQ
jgi:HAD superfamily hydrolase (TIGR01509 family)